MARGAAVANRERKLYVCLWALGQCAYWADCSKLLGLDQAVTHGLQRACRGPLLGKVLAPGLGTRFPSLRAVYDDVGAGLLLHDKMLLQCAA